MINTLKLTIAGMTLLSSVAFAANTNTVNTTPTYNTKADQDKWWHDRDVNNDGKISLKEYVDTETKNDGKTVAMATNEFKSKDKNHDGFINASEFKGWFEKMGDKVVQEKNELKKDYKNSDINHNGK